MCYVCSAEFLLGFDVKQVEVWKTCGHSPQSVPLATIRKTMEVNPKHSIMVELKPLGEELSMFFFHHGQHVKYIKDQTPAKCHIYIKIYDEIWWDMMRYRMI